MPTSLLEAQTCPHIATHRRLPPRPSALTPLLAPLQGYPVEDWMTDYLWDSRLLNKYFERVQEDGQEAQWRPKNPQNYHSGCLWHYDRIIVPQSKVWQLIKQYHDLPTAGHWGINRTVCLLKRRYVIEHVSRLVRQYCKSCLACQQAKAEHCRPRGLVEQLEIPRRQWSSISMDWTNLPEIHDASGKVFNQVLTITDRSSKQVLLVPCRDTDNARDTSEHFIHEVVRHRGLPSSIVSDRDTKFTCQFWQALCQMMEVKHRLTSHFYPQINGQA